MISKKRLQKRPGNKNTEHRSSRSQGVYIRSHGTRMLLKDCDTTPIYQPTARSTSVSGCPQLDGIRWKKGNLILEFIK